MEYLSLQKKKKKKSTATCEIYEQSVKAKISILNDE